MDLKEIGINTRNWVGAAQDRDYWRALAIGALNLPVSELVITHLVQEMRNFPLIQI